jgi:hypothetical protein
MIKGAVSPCLAFPGWPILALRHDRVSRRLSSRRKLLAGTAHKSTIALTIFTNTFNRINDTEVDFPRVA